MERMGRLERLAPLTGILAVALIVAAFIVFGGDAPDADKLAKLTDYWRDNDTEAVISAALLGLAAVPLVWFGGSLRQVLRAAEPGRGRLSHIAFGGFVVFATGLGVGGALQFALGDQADDLSPQAIQTLSALSEDFWFPYVIGISLFMLATGVASLRHGAVHRALGWSALVLGVLALTPVGFVAFLATGPWIVAASIVLYLRGGNVPAAPAAPTARASSPGSPS